MSKAKRTSKATTKKAVAKKVTKKTTSKVGSKAAPKKRATTKKNNEKNKEKTGKGSNPNSQANLKPIKPGEVRNPNGRPKGKLNFDTRVDMAIEALAMQMVEHHNKQPKNKKKQIKLEDIDIEGDIFMQLLNKARGGNEKMIDSFLDRRHGKAVARVELTGKDGDPIAYEEKKQEAKSKARAMLDKWTGKKKK